MKILSIKISNILSIEDAYVEFDDSGLMLVQGWNYDVDRANGAGKTAIFNAITFALYDKLPRKITATEILRRGSKNGSVALCVEVGTEQYIVKRSRPKGVVFFKGTESLTVTQEGWENILKLNYEQFILSMYAAQGVTKRFLSINDGDKKEFLLQLLNLQEFSSCKLIADQKVKELESSCASIQSKLDSIDSKIDAYSESLCADDVITYHISLANQNIVDLTTVISKAQVVTRPDLSKYQKLEEDILVKKTEFTRAKTRREMLHEQYRRIQGKIQPFNAARSCSECGSALDTSAAEAQHSKLLVSLKGELAGIKLEIDHCDNILLKEKGVNELQVKLRDKKREESKDYEIATATVADLQAKINLKQLELKQLNVKLQNNLELNNKIKDLSNLRAQTVNNRATISREIELYKTISAMYSPTGAQAYILDSVIESFNEKVTEYVNLLWSNLTYELMSYKENVKGDVTAKFSETLVMDGKPISIGSLSGGEFRALSLCVDFALVDVMERQFGISMSPIILDEQTEGLDASGKELIMELLSELSSSRMIIVIDHASEVAASFSKVLKIEKRNGISNIIKPEDM
jgi:DNA repair exonuclease SbcCD ATPase subunit